VLRRSTAWLEKRGSESPRLDVEILMAHALGVQRLDLYLQFDRPLQAEELDRVRQQVVKRGEHLPVAYLVGEKGFYSLVFAVDERVLVPRPETELLVETALERLDGSEQTAAGSGPVILDVGTGSGCIALTLLHECSDLRALATDVSADALALAAENAARHEVAERITFLEGDLLEPVRQHAAWGHLAAVLSNPPYIVRGDASVEAGVAAHEPELALYVPGDDPLAYARRIAQAAFEALAPGGFVALEVGHESGAAAHALLEDCGYADVVLRKDLSGIERVAVGVRP